MTSYLWAVDVLPARAIPEVPPMIIGTAQGSAFVSFAVDDHRPQVNIISISPQSLTLALSCPCLISRFIT